LVGEDTSLSEPITNTQNTPDRPQTSAPISDGGEKYDASGWILQRTYDRLVQENSRFLASAPKENINFENAPPAFSPPKKDLEPEVSVDSNTEDSFHSVAGEGADVSQDRVLGEENPFPIQDPVSQASDSETFLLGTSEGASAGCGSVLGVPFSGPNLWEPLATLLFGLWGVMALAWFSLAGLVGWMIWKTREREGAGLIHFKKRSIYPRIRWFLWALVSSFSFSFYPAYAMVSTPESMIYEGVLSDENGQMLSGQYDFRFSLWRQLSFDPATVITGQIDASDPDYHGWSETQSQSLVDGRFSFLLGAVAPIQSELFDRPGLYLQVEVKAQGQPDTNYEFIDLDPNDALMTRLVISTVPFAFNADRLDFRELGFGPGEIPYLDGLGKLTSDILPDIDAVTLEGRNTGFDPGNIPYLDTTGKLDASILPQTPLVNGVEGLDFYLDLDGDAVGSDTLSLYFGSTLGKSIRWEGVSDRFVINDDLSVEGDLTVSGSINGVNLQPKNQKIVLSPRYPNSIFQADGTDNRYGSMYEMTESVNGIEKNIIRWVSSDTSLQDYDVVIRYALPVDFLEFQNGNPISLEHFWEGGSVGDSRVEITVKKENGSVNLLSSGLPVNADVWQKTDLDFLSGTVWSPGETMEIRVRVFSRQKKSAKLGDIVLNYITN
jgi:hypothetical protein